MYNRRFDLFKCWPHMEKTSNIIVSYMFLASNHAGIETNDEHVHI